MCALCVRFSLCFLVHKSDTVDTRYLIFFISTTQLERIFVLRYGTHKKGKCKNYISSNHDTIDDKGWWWWEKRADSFSCSLTTHCFFYQHQQSQSQHQWHAEIKTLLRIFALSFAKSNMVFEREMSFHFVYMHCARRFVKMTRLGCYWNEWWDKLLGNKQQ